MLMEVLVEDFQNLKTIAAKLDHPRTDINLLHPVENIIAISIAAMISGAEGSKFIARRADEKKDWLSGPPCQNSNFSNRNELDAPFFKGEHFLARSISISCANLQNVEPAAHLGTRSR